MRKIFLFALTIFIVSCGKSKKVNLKVEGIEKGTEFSIFKGREKVLSGVISENIILDFSEKDTSEFPNSYILSVKDFGYQNFIVDLGDDVTISYNPETKDYDIKSKFEDKKNEFFNNNPEIAKLKDLIKEKDNNKKNLAKKYKSLGKDADKKELDKIEEEYDLEDSEYKSFNDKASDMIYDIMIKDKKLDYLFIYSSFFYVSNNVNNMDKVLDAINLFTEYTKLYNKDYISKNLESLDGIKKNLEIKEKVSIGNDFVDIEALGLDRKTTIKLSDIVSKHKVVLLKFWASWCGPCINSLPSTLELTKKYGKNGFQVFAVSLDKEDGEDKWKESIEKHGLQSWIHCSELKFWNGENHKKYGVTGIPAEFLIIDGKISSNTKTTRNDMDEMIKEAYSKK